MAISTEISVGLRGLAEVRRRLAGLSQVQLTELNRRMGIQALNWIKENFESQGGLVGGWTGLRPNTIASRRGGSSKILQDSGDLRKSFTISSVDAEKVVVGSADPKALWHERGTKPYVILPKNSRFLVFNVAEAESQGWAWRVTGSNVVFAKKVKHPGLVARRMLPTARDASFMERVITTANKYIVEVMLPG